MTGAVDPIGGDVVRTLSARSRCIGGGPNSVMSTPFR